MSRRLFVCLAILLSSDIHAQVKQPEPGTFFLYPERIVLESGGFLLAERGMMFVPANRPNENANTIAVEVYRFKASNVQKFKGLNV